MERNASWHASVARTPATSFNRRQSTTPTRTWTCCLWTRTNRMYLPPVRPGPLPELLHIYCARTRGNLSRRDATAICVGSTFRHGVLALNRESYYHISPTTTTTTTTHTTITTTAGTTTTTANYYCYYLLCCVVSAAIRIMRQMVLTSLS